MKVHLLRSTPDALRLLVATKNTRLKLDPNNFIETSAAPEELLLREWQYMMNTIKSSWEFVEYVFLITDVTRAFTQQLERHRVGTSFAEQSLRAVDKSNFDYLMPDFPDELLVAQYAQTMNRINEGYRALLNQGVNIQDARGLLPLNVLTNIVFKANLRALSDMAKIRLCVRTQGEFQDVFRSIREAVCAIHPWTEPVLRVQCATNCICAFPDFPAAKCPVKPYAFNPETGMRYGSDGTLRGINEVDALDLPLTPDQIQVLWEDNRAAVQPTVHKETK